MRTWIAMLLISISVITYAQVPVPGSPANLESPSRRPVSEGRVQRSGEPSGTAICEVERRILAVLRQGVMQMSTTINFRALTSEQLHQLKKDISEILAKPGINREVREEYEMLLEKVNAALRAEDRVLRRGNSERNQSNGQFE